MDAEKFLRLNARLQRPTDRTETGQLLPKTAAAIALPGGSARLEALVTALLEERLVVPVPVEGHPEKGGSHQTHDLQAALLPDPVAASSVAGPALVAFTSARSLLDWDPSGRPMPVTAQKLALTAVASGRYPIWVDAQTTNLLIPTPAVLALAKGHAWQPPWRDEELLTDLQRRADEVATTGPIGVEIQIFPLSNATGGIRVQLLVTPRSELDKKTSQAVIMQKIRQIVREAAASPFLRFRADQIEFSPKFACHVSEATAPDTP